MEGVIIKDDARYNFVEGFLRNKGYVFHGTDAPPEGLDFLVLPFKEDIDTFLFGDKYFAAMKKSARVFSGLRNAYALRQCARHGIEYHAAMDDNGIAIKNAVPTSEGVIAYIIANRDRTIAKSRILIIGYGVCGRDMAKRLKALDSEIYALVRSREKECAAFADGVTPVYLDDIARFRFDVYINTVPGRALTDEIVLGTAGALLIDIASYPYGFDMGLAKGLNAKSALLPGIPGKFAVRSSGEILGEYIHNILTGRVANDTGR